MTPKRWICLALVLLVAGCFGHACLAEFVDFDDPLYVTQTPQVLGGLTWSNIGWACTDAAYRVGFWIPVTWLSLQCDATLWGPGGAWGFHLTNVILHAVGVVLFFLGLHRVTDDFERSAVAATLFAIHPLRAESVAWVTERKDMLSLLFLLLTVGAYLRYVEQRTWGRYALIHVFFLLGLASKPSVVPLPFGLLLLDYWPLGRLRWGQVVPSIHAARPAERWYSLIVEKIPLLGMSLVSSGMTLYFSNTARFLDVVLPWHTRLATAASGYLSYLERTFWPTDLAAYYPYHVPTLPRVALALAVLGATTAGLLWLGRTRPMLSVGWLWFLGMLFPVSGIAQAGGQLNADRFTHLPHLGFMILVTWGVSDVLSAYLSPRGRRILFGIVVAGLIPLTWVQVWYWRDTESLFFHTVEVTPPNAFAHRMLAGWWWGRGDADNALHNAERAVAAAPHDFRTRSAYAGLLLAVDRPEQAKDQLQAAIDRRPDHLVLRMQMGQCLLLLGSRAEAAVHFQQALALGGRAEALVGLVQCALPQGKLDDASRYIEQALELEPNFVPAWHWSGVVSARRRDWAAAESRFQKTLALDPQREASRGYLALSFAKQGKDQHAGREYAVVLRHAPDFAWRTAEHAWKLVTWEELKDGRAAEELALQACGATAYTDIRALDALAAAQAAMGDFDAAVATIKSALARNPIQRQQLEQRLQLYERRQAMPTTSRAKRQTGTGAFGRPP